MADGGPDLQAQLLQMQSLIASSRGSGPAAGVCGGVLRDVEISSLSLRAGALKGDATFRPTSGRPRAADTICQKLGISGAAILEDFRKAATNAGVMYAGNVTNGPPTVSNVPVSAGGDRELV